MNLLAFCIPRVASKYIFLAILCGLAGQGSFGICFGSLLTPQLKHLHRVELHLFMALVSAEAGSRLHAPSLMSLGSSALQSIQLCRYLMRFYSLTCVAFLHHLEIAVCVACVLCAA